MQEGITRISRTRRKYSAEFKARVLRECAAAGASVAGTALAHGINANLVHRWRQLARSAVSAQFVALAAPGVSPAAAQSQAVHTAAEPIHISVQRGAMCARVAWPAVAADECAAWLTALLK